MKYFVVSIAAVLLLAASPASAAVSELHIFADGSFSAKNMTVIQRAGTNLFCRVSWGDAFVRITVLTAPAGVAAKIEKKHGGAATVKDIREGDLLNVEGMLASGTGTLVVNAARITDLSLESESKVFTGSVVSVNATQSSFVLSTKTNGKITVNVSSATITKGVRTIGLSEIKAGDKVLAASGNFDYPSASLAAAEVSLYQDKAVFASRNFEGKLKSIEGTTLPTSLLVAVGGAEYRVYLSESSKILSKNKASTSLTRFAAGDTVRFYGAIREGNLFEVDAEIVRNLAF